MVKPLVVIPTFNESENIDSILDEILLLPESFHVLIVDDASPDGTGDRVVAQQKGRPKQQADRLHILRRLAKTGLGSAYRDGFAWAVRREYTHYCQMDADFSHAPSDLTKLLKATSDFDVAVGSRWIQEGKTFGWSWIRKVLSRCANVYARTVLGHPIRDLTSGFKCYRRRAIIEIDPSKMQSEGYTFQIETLARAKKQGLTMTEVPITFRERKGGKSKISSISTTFQTIFLVLQLRIQNR